MEGGEVKDGNLPGRNGVREQLSNNNGERRVQSRRWVPLSALSQRAGDKHTFHGRITADTAVCLVTAFPFLISVEFPPSLYPLTRPQQQTRSVWVPGRGPAEGDSRIVSVEKAQG